jgi:hypothetical protein
MLYFAYGSNLSSRRLRARVASASFVSVASLQGHQLRFHKSSSDGSAKCDAFDTGDIAHRVIGVVHRIEPLEKPVLDRFEGLGFGYEQRNVVVTGNDGRPHEVFTYRAIKLDPDRKPYDWYHQHVIVGAEEFALPASYIEQLRAVETVADPDPLRHRRELAIYD